MKTILLIIAAGGVSYLVYKQVTKGSKASVISQIMSKIVTPAASSISTDYLQQLSLPTLKAWLASNSVNFSNAEIQAWLAAHPTV